ncbi:hypothetical protein JQ636_40560 [Bradyrhizobium japonicum]|uniref:hypothetical protein n=1 Tax=Bradyrhizobium japonicum TaxID=375 RepID=UPI001BAD6327|nr:hypothetical protein [Bradyrhizobium japonicum]MBR0731093.1 hypothetical protein [Bradyrhizobium japonicum]MBR0809851.1 hypothetical protein [Bradyrhizobium japonicum]
MAYSPVLHIKGGGGMIGQPHFNSYSIQARICLGIAIFGAALLVAALLASTYLVQ